MTGKFKFQVSTLGKKFYNHWVFKSLSFEIQNGESLLITGPNGSGKSTLMRILAGQLTPTRGKVELFIGGHPIELFQFYKHISWTGPYFDLYGDLTLMEAIKLHFRFKKSLLNSSEAVVEALRLQGHGNKKLAHFSSGMLHRVKVGLCLFTDAPVLLLDEPGTNLDEENAGYIYQKLEEFRNDRLLIFVSNNPAEFDQFKNRLDLGDFI